MKVWLILAEILKTQKLNFFCYALFHMKTRASLKYFVSYCLWKHFFDINLPQTPLIFASWNCLVTLRPFTLF